MADTALNVIEGTALSAEQKKDLMNRLARVEGQLRGVQKLIAKASVPADCEGVAQQMSAARKALDRAFVTLLTSAMLTQSNDEKNAAVSVKRLADLLNKFA